MNTEIRDHLNWLKGALNVITDTSATDTGVTTYLGITSATSSSVAYVAKVTGDTTGNRLIVRASGKMEWGAGGTSATDVSLERGAAGVLITDGALMFGSSGSYLSGDGYVSLTENGDPGAGAANVGRLYARDNGSGKTQLCVVFSSGAVQVLATQP